MPKTSPPSAPITLDTISASLTPAVTKASQFGNYSLNRNDTIEPPHWTKRQGRSVPNSLLLITLFTFVSAFLLLWTRMIATASDPTTRDTALAQTYISAMIWLDTYLGYPGIQILDTSLTGVVTEDTFRHLQDASVPYVFKKDLSDSQMFALSSSLIRQSKTLRDTQTEIAKYGFLDPEIMVLLQTDQNPIPIITSLHTIETIKFGTALKMFSLLDTFIQQTSRLVDTSKENLMTVIAHYLERGEKDTARYLTTCYLNPYETLPDCKQIGDFANYFRFEEKNASFDPALFAKIMSVVDNKLEQSELPSLQIDFDRFAPNAQSL